MSTQATIHFFYVGIDLNAEYEAMAWGRIFPHPPLEEVLSFMGDGW